MVRESLERVFAFRVARASFPLERALSLLASVGLEEECLSRPPESLSVGQKQRVSLVRALLVNPRVILLDEPTGPLDEHSRCAV